MAAPVPTTPFFDAGDSEAIDATAGALVAVVLAAMAGKAEGTALPRNDTALRRPSSAVEAAVLKSPAVACRHKRRLRLRQIFAGAEIWPSYGVVVETLDGGAESEISDSHS